METLLLPHLFMFLNNVLFDLKKSHAIESVEQYLSHLKLLLAGHLQSIFLFIYL
jgi:hypothetical protein